MSTATPRLTVSQRIVRSPRKVAFEVRGASGQGDAGGAGDERQVGELRLAGRKAGGVQLGAGARPAPREVDVDLGRHVGGGLRASGSCARRSPAAPDRSSRPRAEPPRSPRAARRRRRLPRARSAAAEEPTGPAAPPTGPLEIACCTSALRIRPRSARALEPLPNRGRASLAIRLATGEAVSRSHLARHGSADEAFAAATGSSARARPAPPPLGSPSLAVSGSAAGKGRGVELLRR